MNINELNDDVLSIIFPYFNKDILHLIACVNKKFNQLAKIIINNILQNPYQLIYEIKHHNLGINNIDFFYNGNLLTCSDDQTLKILNPYKNECINEVVRHQGSVNDCVIYQNQNEFISASNDGFLCIWKTDIDEPWYQIIHIHDEPVIKCIITNNDYNDYNNNDDNIIACTLSGIINIWDSEFAPLYTLNKWNSLNNIGLETNLYYNVLLASSRFQIGISYKVDKYYYIGDANIICTQKKSNNLNIINLKYKCCHTTFSGHRDKITACCLYKKNNVISVCSKYMTFWNRWNKNNKLTFKHNCFQINLLKIDYSGNIIAGCSDGTIKCWKINSKI